MNLSYLFSYAINTRISLIIRLSLSSMCMLCVILAFIWSRVCVRVCVYVCWLVCMTLHPHMRVYYHFECSLGHLARARSLLNLSNIIYRGVIARGRATNKYRFRRHIAPNILACHNNTRFVLELGVTSVIGVNWYDETIIIMEFQKQESCT